MSSTIAASEPRFVITLALGVTASYANDERPSTVVVRVSDDGFHWADAGLGAAVALATTLLMLGLVLALRPAHGGSRKASNALS